MPELRWILLVLGALLIGGLWWWELRRSRSAATPIIPSVEPESRAERHEPRLAADEEVAPLEASQARASDDRAIPRGDPPVVTLDDLPEDTDRIVLAREPAPARRIEPSVPAAGRVEPEMAADAWPEEDVVPDLEAVDTRPPAGFARARFGASPADRSGTHAGSASAPRESGAVPSASAAPRDESVRAEPTFREPGVETRAGAPRPTAGRREPSIETTADLSRSAPPPVLDRIDIPVQSGGASASGAASTANSAAASLARPRERTAAGSPGHAAAPPTGSGPGSVAGIESRRPAPRPIAAPRPAAPEPTRSAEPPSPQQRIVAIRLVGSNGARFDGAELRAALEAEGLRFGKYSIFHRQRADGRTLYSVASLVEPGSFDLDAMSMLEFPGVSMFAVFPGPVDAPEAYDELLATARRLADRLRGTLQDERGGPLSAQRVLGVREELVSFQNLVSRMRSRPAS